jgi:Pyruvate/2-oxoacid:ferredoxin oxidoreductase delta subunit
VAGLHRSFDAVIVATGLAAVPVAGTRRGVEPAAAFLRDVSAGRTRRLAGRVVVLGGDDTALDCARTALRCGAAEVALVHDGPRESMTAHADDIEDAADEGVRFHFLRAARSFEVAGGVTGVVVEELAPGADGALAGTGRLSAFAAETVLDATSRAGDLSAVPPGWKLEDGRFSEGATPLRAFAAGDVLSGARSAAAAIGDGRRAAMRALSAVGIAASVPSRPDLGRAVRPDSIRFEHFAKVEAASPVAWPREGRLAGFEEARAGLDDASEAKRCLSCGKCTQCDTCLVYCPEGVIRRRGNGYVVDGTNCKGCGICVTECPRRAMEMSAS